MYVATRHTYEQKEHTYIHTTIMITTNNKMAYSYSHSYSNSVESGRRRVILYTETTHIRPLFVGFMFFIRKFPGWYAGGRVITITHYTHFKFLLSKFSQIMAKIIIMNVGIDKTFLKFKFSQEIINNGEKCG